MTGRSIDNPLHLNCRHIGSGRVDCLFDRVLERERRRWAAVAASLHPQANDAARDPHQFDVAVMRPQERPHSLQGLLNAGFQVEWMKSVQQQQARHDIIVRQRRDQMHRPGSPISATRPEQPRQRRPVEVQQGLDKLAGLVARGGIGQSLEVVDQGLDVLDPAPGFGIWCGNACHGSSPTNL